MKNMLRIFLLDLKSLRSNVVALVVCVGMLAVPSLYAWFNIAGSWDPYGNTKNLSVAVANTDKGYTSELLPMSINVGDRVVSALHENDAIGWVFVDEDEAVEGVTSGKYYAAIVIPENFSDCLLGMLSDENTGKAELVYYDNEKENSIASIVTDKASAAVKEQIDTTFSKTIGEIGTGVIGDLSDYLSGDTVKAFAAKLDVALGDAIATLGSARDTVDSYGALVGSAEQLVSGSQTLLATSTSDVGKVADKVDSLATKLESAATKLEGTTTSVNETVSKAESTLDDLQSRIDRALDNGTAAADESESNLRALAGEAKSRGDGYHRLADNVEAAAPVLSDVSDRLDRAGDALDDLSDTLGNAADKAADKSGSLSDSKSVIQGEIAKAKDSLTSASDTYEQKIQGDLKDVVAKTRKLATTARSVSDKTEATLDRLDALAGSAAGDLSSIASSLKTVGEDLDETIGELEALRTKVEDALASGDMKLVTEVLGNDSETIATYLSSPVSLNKIAVYPVDNNGTAMAPFYTCIGLWIAGIVLIVLVKTDVSDEQRARVPGCKTWQAVMGRWLTFAFFGSLQGLLIAVGDIVFLQIQCLHPGLFILSCMLSAVVYVSIMYVLTSAFGDVGKALAIFLLVIQVAGSGGTFPPAMLPETFQAINPWLPYTVSMTAMRGCIAGIYGADYAVAMGKLALYLVPCLAVALLVRPVVIKGTDYLVEQMESTKVMM
jgi:putative membrane protein